MRLALVFVALASCRREDVATKPNDREVPRDAPEVEELPRVRILADIAEHNRKRVVVEAVYEVEPIARGKGGRRVWLVLTDGTKISRAYDWVKSEFAYADRRVRATGTITSGPPDPYMQAMMGPHLKLEKLELAGSEPPIDEAITELRAPPLASATPALGKQIDRWVQVVATLAAVSGDTATLKLADGGVVRVEDVVATTWSPHLGKTVTVTGKLAMEKGSAGAFALDLVFRRPTAICPGVVARCGM